MARDVLATDTLDTSDITRVRAEIERANAMRLQPHYIRSFFSRAIEDLGGRLASNRNGTYRIRRVPLSLAVKSSNGARRPLADSYASIAFEKELVEDPGRTDLVCVGHPLLDAAVEETLAKHGKALSEGKYSEAIGLFNILSRLDSTDCWTFFYRGIAKYNLGDLRGAYTDFNTSVRLNPVFTNGYHFRGITLSRSGKYDEALEDFNHALELRPGLNGLYFSRGVNYFLAQQFDKAVEDFDYYIKKEPKDPSAFLNRGASYLFLADTTKALEDYNKAIKLDRFEPEGFIRRGGLWAASG